MDRKQLIEDAAKALTGLTDAEWEIATAEGTDHLTGYFEAAERVLAVFEGAGSFLPVASEVQQTAHTDDERIVQEFYAEHYGPASGWRVERLDLAVFVPTIKPGDVLDLVREVLIGAGLDIRAVPLHRAVRGEPSATCPKCGVTVTGQTPSTFYSHHDETCGGWLEEPQQGEPSDAQVLDALNAQGLSQHERSGVTRHFNPAPDLSYYSDGNVQDMRAALRAAAETGGER